MRRLGRIRTDRTPPEQMNVHYWQDRNPIVLEGLVHVRLRYFDPEKKRAGIAEDVAALVDQITGDGVRVTLVNTSTTAARETILQAGAFGEHQFVTVDDGKSKREVNSKHLAVRLAPGAVGTLTITMRRWGNRPSYEWPAAARR
jgi:transcriptional regulator of nitric oxide reductase